MNILAVLPAYPPHSMVGAWVSTHECLRHMVRRGHEVGVACMGTARRPYTHDGVRVIHQSTLAARSTRGVDVVLGHMGDNGRARRVAETRNLPLVTMVHGVNGGEKAALSHRSGTRLAVFPSEAARAAVGWSGASVVVHPPSDPADYRVDPVGTEVTLVNLSAEKGGRTFWALAAELPHLPFLGVRGGYGPQILVAAPNVALLGHTADMRKVYRRTRILLVPSITETWGRVGVEAAASGIPIIAHPSPGLQEALGDAAIWLDRSDIDAWADVIRSLAMPSVREAAMSRSLARSAALDPLPELERFAEHLEAL